MSTQTKVRRPTHAARSFTSDVVHAAHSNDGRWHVIACNGRAIEGMVVNRDDPASFVNCRQCEKAFTLGKAVWA